MFLLNVGLILPELAELETLPYQDQLWQHIQLTLCDLVRCELQILTTGKVPVVLWARTSDDQPPPVALLKTLQRLAETMGAELRLDLAEWSPPIKNLMATTDVLLLVADRPEENQLDRSDEVAVRLWHERCDSHLPQQSSVLARLGENGQIVDTTHRIGILSASEPDDIRELSTSEIRTRRRWHVAHWINDWRNAEEPVGHLDPGLELSSAAWQTQKAVNQARSLCVHLNQSCRRWLWGRWLPVIGCAWLLTTWLGRPGLWISAVLFLAAGTWSWRRCRHPREEAQQWWCLAQCLWVQETWHRFGLDGETAAHIALDLPLKARRERIGPLTALLQSHQMALLCGDKPQPWSGRELEDVVITLGRREKQLEQEAGMAEKSRVFRLLTVTLLAILLLLVLMDLVPVPMLLIKLLLLSCLVLCFLLWLGRPGSALPPQRLHRHLAHLRHHQQQLRQLQRQSEFKLATVRSRVESQIHRLGQEELDLARDGLEGSGWT